MPNSSARAPRSVLTGPTISSLPVAPSRVYFATNDATGKSRATRGLRAENRNAGSAADVDPSVSNRRRQEWATPSVGPIAKAALEENVREIARVIGVQDERVTLDVVGSSDRPHDALSASE